MISAYLEKVEGLGTVRAIIDAIELCEAYDGAPVAAELIWGALPTAGFRLEHDLLLQILDRLVAIGIIGRADQQDVRSYRLLGPLDKMARI